MNSDRAHQRFMEDLCDPASRPDWWQEHDISGINPLGEVQYLPKPGPSNPPSDGLLTIPQVAERLQVGRCTAQALLLDGSIASFKIGRLRRTSAEAVDDYIRRSLSDRQG